MEFSRPEYWSEQPFPSPVDLPNPGIEPRPPTLQVDSSPAEPQGKAENTGVGSLSLFQGIFPTQKLNWGLLHCWWILYQLSYQGSRVIIPGRMQTDSIINLCPNCKPGFVLMPLVSSHKTCNVAKPVSWLVRPLPGAQQSQDSSPILSMMLPVLHSWQAVTPACPGRLEAGSEACSALSLKPKQDYLFNFPTRKPI